MKKIKNLNGYQRHHLIEKRFKDALYLTSEQVDMMPAVFLDNATHSKITQALKREIGYDKSGAKIVTSTASRKRILEAHKKVYEEFGLDIFFEIGETFLLENKK